MKWAIICMTLIPKSVIIMFATAAAIHVSDADAVENERLLFARFEVVSANMQVVGTRLLMDPVDNDFRADRFVRYRIDGHAVYDGQADIETQVRHNAISRLLTKFGLISVHTESRMIARRPFQMTTVRYEGVVKYPVSVTSETCTGGASDCTLSLEIVFAPIASPDKWSILYLKQKVAYFFRQTIPSFFTHR